eukprot:TRINITY_DN30198_c0_g1_i1.p1 TRINITY_DN30198_c0_g1~~TRINITY_DN30198_c0_g1_i1.p1  ORF type:complete len:778 (-),score=125.28 TRINITY_DN30198_c0_g1_i1:298-2631(-)
MSWEAALDQSLLALEREPVICDASVGQVIEGVKSIIKRLEPPIRRDPLACLRQLVAAYLELYKLRGGATVTNQAVRSSVREASRHLRDAVVICCRGLLTNYNRDDLLSLLEDASDGSTGAGGPDGENLRSSLLKAWFTLFGPLPSSSKRARKNSAARRREKASTHTYAPYSHALPTPNFYYPQGYFPMCWGWADYSQFSHWQEDVGWGGEPQENVGSGSEGETLQEPRRENVEFEAERQEDTDCRSEVETLQSFPGTDLSAMYQPCLPAKCPTDQISIPETLDSFELRPKASRHVKVALLSGICDELETPEEGAGGDEDDYAAGTPLDMMSCAECKAEDPDGWHDKWSNYYCSRCWAAWDQTRRSAKEPDKVDEQQDLPPETFKFEKLDPVPYIVDAPTTEVFVQGEDALELAHLMNSACVVALGGETLLPGQHRRHCKDFFVRTNFTELFKEHMGNVPRWGGLYAPKVKVTKDASLEVMLKSFELPAMYAAVAWGPNFMNWKESSDWKTDWKRFRGEIREKIQNVLRACHKHNHDSIIVSMASACFEGAPASTFAELWYECLFGAGDTSGLVRRVVFSTPPKTTPLKVRLAFQQEFLRSREVLLRGTAIRDEGQMLVLAGSKQCLDARLDVRLLVSENETGNGVTVGLCEILASANQEHQVWLLLPCGRLVLAEFPWLCLNASSRRAGDYVHLWKRVEHMHKDEDMQTWQVHSDGTMSLVRHPHLRLTAKSEKSVILEPLSEAKDGQIWEMASVDLSVARLVGPGSSDRGGVWPVK